MNSEVWVNMKRYTIKPVLPIWAQEGNKKLSKTATLFSDRKGNCAWLTTVSWEDKKGKINTSVFTVKWINRDFTTAEIEDEITRDWIEIDENEAHARIRRRCMLAGHHKYGTPGDEHLMCISNKQVMVDDYLIAGVRFRVAAALCNEDSEWISVHKEDYARLIEFEEGK